MSGNPANGLMRYIAGIKWRKSVTWREYGSGKVMIPATVYFWGAVKWNSPILTFDSSDAGMLERDFG